MAGRREAAQRGRHNHHPGREQDRQARGCMLPVESPMVLIVVVTAVAGGVLHRGNAVRPRERAHVHRDVGTDRRERVGRLRECGSPHSPQHGDRVCRRLPELAGRLQGVPLSGSEASLSAVAFVGGRVSLLRNDEH